MPQIRTPRVVKWRRVSYIALIAVFALLIVFHTTTASMIKAWASVATYNHSFFILPIALWLIWHDREQLIQLHVPRAAWSPLILFTAASLVWIGGHLSTTIAAEQIALVVMVIATVWAILGHRATWCLFFPLVFLFLALPVFHGFETPIQELTAKIVYELLRLSGMAADREGIYLSTEIGVFSIDSGCSGLRYILPSASLGILYAYLIFHTTWRRVAFISIAFLVPFAVNVARIYLIIIAGSFTDIDVAIELHDISGWVLFGVIVLILLGAGMLFSETPRLTTPVATYPSFPRVSRSAGVAATCVFLAVAVRAVAWDHGTKGFNLTDEPNVPSGANGWSISATAWDWTPRFSESDNVFRVFYRKNDDVTVGIDAAHFVKNSHKSEAASWKNIPTRQTYTNIKIFTSTMADQVSSRVATPANVFEVDDGTKRLRVWHWYRIGARRTDSLPLAKLFGILNRLQHSRSDAAVFTIATEITASDSAADWALSMFVEDMLPLIEQELDRSIGIDSKSLEH